MARTREATARRRENVMALAGLLLVAGSLGISAAGSLLVIGRRRGAAVAGGAGVLLGVAAVLVFINRPIEKAHAAKTTLAAVPATDVALGRLQCRFVPEASRATVSTPADLPFDWAKGGCADGRRQFVPGAVGWSRIELVEPDEAVADTRFDPATRRLIVTRYLLSATDMRVARAARGTASDLCGGEAALATLVRQQSAIRATLPALPNEKLVYQCGGR